MNRRDKTPDTTKEEPPRRNFLGSTFSPSVPKTPILRRSSQDKTVGETPGRPRYYLQKRRGRSDPTSFPRFLSRLTYTQPLGDPDRSSP